MVPVARTHDACCLQQQSDARSVVVGPRGPANAVGGVGRAVVVMGHQHDDAIATPFARQRGDDVALVGGIAAVGHGEVLELNRQSSIAHAHELVEDPAPRRADAERLRLRVTEGVARAEALQLADVGDELLL